MRFEKNYHIDSHRMLNFVAASRRLTQDKHIYLLTTHRPPSPPFHSLFMSPMLIIAVVGDSHRSIFMLIVLLPRYVVTRHKRAPKILLSTQSYSKPIDNLFGWMHLCCYTMLGFDPKKIDEQLGSGCIIKTSLPCVKRKLEACDSKFYCLFDEKSSKESYFTAKAVPSVQTYQIRQSTSQQQQRFLDGRNKNKNWSPF